MALNDIQFGIRLEGYRGLIIYLFVPKQISFENSQNINFENYLLKNSNKSKLPVTCYLNPDYNINTNIIDEKLVTNYSDRFNVLYANYKTGKMSEYKNLKIKNGSFDRNYSRNIPIESKLIMFNNALENPKFWPAKLDVNLKNSEISMFLANSSYLISADISDPHLREFVNKEITKIKNDIFYYNILMQDVYTYRVFKKTHQNPIIDENGIFVRSNDMYFNNFDELSRVVQYFLKTINLRLSALYKTKKIINSKIEKSVVICDLYETMKTIEYLIKNFNMSITHVSNKSVELVNLTTKLKVADLEIYPLSLNVEAPFDISHFPESFD